MGVADEGQMNDHDLSKIHITSWPAACPSKYEDHLISITCGNSHYHWAVHRDISASFMPSLFWRTPVLRSDEIDRNDSCEELARFLPKGCQKIIFGTEEAPVNKTQAAKAASEKRIPALSIYIISTNEDHETGLEYLFRDVPCRLYKFKANDFFTKDQGAYNGIGVDRLAALKASVAFHENPSLVIDGGTALTYTGTDHDGNVIGGGIVPGLALKFRSLVDYTGALPNIEQDDILGFIKDREEASTNNNNNSRTVFEKDTKKAIMTSALTEVAALCRIAIKNYLKSLDEATAAKEAEAAKAKAAETTTTTEKTTTDTPTTADATSAENGGTTTTTSAAAAEEVKESTGGGEDDKMEVDKENGTDDTDGNKKEKEAAVVAAATTAETKKKDKDINQPNCHICITGGDGDIIYKLLKENHSNIIPTEPDCIMPKEGQDTFILKKVKHLIHYGISKILTEKAQYFEKASNNEIENKLRAEIIGQRVAKEFDISGSSTDHNDRIFRGTIIAIAPGPGSLSTNSTTTTNGGDGIAARALDKDWFYVRYDDGDSEHFGISELYDGLVLFHQHGEKVPTMTDGNKKKSEEAKKTADMLKDNSAKVQKHIVQLEENKKRIAAGEKIITPTGAPGGAPGAKARRRSGSNTTTSTTADKGGTGGKDNPNKRQRKESVGKGEKKAKTKPATEKGGTTTTTKTENSSSSFDPYSYENLRIAKYFDTELYFGTVTRYIKPIVPGDVDLWHILYDDDDQEDYDKKDLKTAVALYKQMYKEDPKKPTTNTTKPPSTTTKVSEEIGSTTNTNTNTTAEAAAATTTTTEPTPMDVDQPSTTNTTTTAAAETTTTTADATEKSATDAVAAPAAPAPTAEAPAPATDADADAAAEPTPAPAATAETEAPAPTPAVPAAETEAPAAAAAAEAPAAEQTPTPAPVEAEAPATAATEPTTVEAEAPAAAAAAVAVAEPTPTSETNAE